MVYKEADENKHMIIKKVVFVKSLQFCIIYCQLYSNDFLNS